MSATWETGSNSAHVMNPSGSVGGYSPCSPDSVTIHWSSSIGMTAPPCVVGGDVPTSIVVVSAGGRSMRVVA